MDIRKIKKLIELLEESGVSEIEIKEGEESVRIARNGPVEVQAAPAKATGADRGELGDPGCRPPRRSARPAPARPPRPRRPRRRPTRASTS